MLPSKYRKTIGLRKRARAIIDIIQDSDVFNDDMDIAKYAMSYAIYLNLNCKEQVSDATTTWNVGSIDDEGYIKNLISSLYPDVSDPYKKTEALIDAGLMEIGKKIDQAGGVFILEDILPF